MTVAASSKLRVSVQTGPFDIAAETARLQGAADDCGALATFTGIVRAEADGKQLSSMVLEHYPDMTEHALLDIGQKAIDRFALQAVAIVHRVGELRPGELIVLVAAAARHRHAAFDGAAFIMDYLKTDAPFWKKEISVDGQATWVGARDSDDEALQRWRR